MVSFDVKVTGHEVTKSEKDVVVAKEGVPAEVSKLTCNCCEY